MTRSNDGVELDNDGEPERWVAAEVVGVSVIFCTDVRKIIY